MFTNCLKINHNIYEYYVDHMVFICSYFSIKYQTNINLSKIVTFLEFPNGFSILFQTVPSFLALILNLYFPSLTFDSYVHSFQWQFLFEIGFRRRRKKIGLLPHNSQWYSVLTWCLLSMDSILTNLVNGSWTMFYTMCFILLLLK